MLGGPALLSRGPSLCCPHRWSGTSAPSIPGMWAVAENGTPNRKRPMSPNQAGVFLQPIWLAENQTKPTQTDPFLAGHAQNDRNRGAVRRGCAQRLDGQEIEGPMVLTCHRWKEIKEMRHKYFPHGGTSTDRSQARGAIVPHVIIPQTWVYDHLRPEHLVDRYRSRPKTGPQVWMLTE